ncbi:DUF3995 domain-containing protein [Brevibacillus parabrevis]|uniref:DUF3995 domain-containing protein n=1 Tax=Brevibacillus parabrevis TaxID=54914 RepID=UPI0028D1E576|nr:DUF3995 domain-containing protein [Brevibacillus parabrevis]MED1722336.1 DUF3995 domain-containing protein [Brevibacillus parabrevis]
MTTFVVLSAAIILAVLSLLHVYWAFGGRWGSTAAIPVTAHDSRPLFRPGKIGTLIVAGLLLFADYLLLAQSGYLAPLIAPALIQWGCIFGTAAFFLRAVGDFRYVGFFKKVRHTVFGRQDTRLFTPLCLWLGMAFLLTVL